MGRWMERKESPWDVERRLCLILFHSGLSTEDRVWVSEQLALTGVRVPTRDTSWMEMEYIR